MKAITALVAAIAVSYAHAAGGLDYIMVGDFGWTFNMTDPNKNFDAIDLYVGNVTAKGGKINFLMTMGDNFYLANESYPTQHDVDSVMGLFNRTNLEDLYIYAIRGNHDCGTHDPYFEVNITKQYPNWRMPDLYYSRLFDIGNGKFLGALFVDTCIAVCSNYSYAGNTGGKLLMEDVPINEKPNLSPEMDNLMFGILNCSDPFYSEKGEEMYKWINQTLNDWKSNPNIAWRASIQHHPMFSKWWDDYINITSNLMPLLMDYKVDFYLNGHEHDLTYAYYPYDQVPSFLSELKSAKHNLQDYVCKQGQEQFFGYNTRYSEFSKGDALHQVTTGATGNDFTDLCNTRPSMGRYRFANNMQHGFSHVYVDEHEFTVKIMGIDYATLSTKEIYRITVVNDQMFYSMPSQ